MNTSDLRQRAQFREAAARSEAEEKLKANQLMEESKQALQYNQFTKAADMLTQVSRLNPQCQQLHLFNAWAKLGLLDPAKKAFQLKEIELEIMQIPPDERYDAIFPFILGLFSKAKGDVLGARKSLQKSVAMDPSFMAARREISLLDSQNKKQDILKMDLKEMVSNFFKKKA
jgi:tetratricopeptide (TPR) repeat protein